MLAVLQFIFSGFWVFVGTLMLTSAIIGGTIKLAAVFVVGLRGGSIKFRE